MPKHRDLLFARLYYFAYLGGWGFILPFINLYYISLGLTGKQIGTLSSTSAIVGLTIAPFYVAEVKRHPQARRLLQFSLFLGAALYLLLSQQTEFLPIVAIVFFLALATSGLAPVSDSMAVAVAQENDTGYGSIRVWASVGWIITVLASGWLVERLGYQAGFAGVSLMWLAAIGLLFFINKRHFSRPPAEGKAKTGLRTAIARVFNDRTLLGFAFALVCVGFLNSGVLQFENVFLSQLGASKQLISVAGILSAVVELPFMIIADKLVKRFGPHPMLLLAIGLTMFQRLAVFLFPYIPTIMIVRFIGGVAFSFYTISFVQLINSRTDASETGTVLALFTVTLPGLVNIFAAPTAGAIFDAVGAQWLYLLSTCGYAVALASLWLTRPKNP